MTANRSRVGPRHYPKIDLDTRLATRIDQLPRIRLAHLPTPFEELGRLGRLVGANLWIKRDDCTGLAFGGNKTRKLEFAIGEALAAGADTLIASSTYQSNFVRQTAAASAKLGLEFHGVIADPPPGRRDSYFSSGNLLLDDLLGAQLHLVADEGPATDAKVAELMANLRAGGRTPFHILRGSSNAVGAIGYVECARELLAQAAVAGFQPSAVFVVTGGGGGQAGLLVGLRLLGADTRVIGISCSEPSEAKREKVKSAIAGIFERLEISVDIADDEIIVDDAYTGGAYAVPTKAANEAIKLTASMEGLILDPIYTGKGMAGILDHLAKDKLPRSEPIVFVHTGGGPALFVYDDLFWSGVPRP